jgi:hypothetical protein
MVIPVIIGATGIATEGLRVKNVETIPWKIFNTTKGEHHS